MDLRQLGFFVRIVESGSFSRAAKSLNVAQPSLSQRIKDLERELGVDLLHRSPTGVKPTDVGTIVADRARSILKQVDHLKTEVRGQAATPTGNVTVGLPTTMALHLTVPLVQQVREKLPGINLHVTEGMSGHIQEWVLSGRIDVAILYSADPVPGLELELLLTEDLYLIAARRKHQNSPASLTLADVADFPLVLPGRDHGLRRNIERAALDAKVTLNVPVEVELAPAHEAPSSGWCPVYDPPLGRLPGGNPDGEGGCATDRGPRLTSTRGTCGRPRPPPKPSWSLHSGANGDTRFQGTGIKGAGRQKKGIGHAYVAFAFLPLARWPQPGAFVGRRPLAADLFHDRA